MLLTDPSLGNEFGQMLVAEIVGQFQLQPGLQGHGGGIRIAGSDSLVFSDQINALIIPDDQSLEADPSAKHLGKNPRIDVAGQILEFIEGGHHRGRLGVPDHCPKGSYVVIKQMPWAERVGRTVSSTLGAAVSGKVLEGGGHVIRIDGTVG